MYRLLPQVLLGFALVLAGCSSPEEKVNAASVKPEKERRPAPDFTLKDADGRTARLSDYRGQVVLLDFWATWCGPCKIEIPWFIDLQRTHKDRGFAVLGLSMDDEGWEVVKPFMNRLKVNYRMMIADEPTAQLYGGIDALPTTFLIDRQGRIAAVHIGLGSRKDFENGVEELLRSPAPADVSGTGEPARPARAD